MANTSWSSATFESAPGQILEKLQYDHCSEKAAPGSSHDCKLQKYQTPRFLTARSNLMMFFNFVFAFTLSPRLHFDMAGH